MTEVAQEAEKKPKTLDAQDEGQQTQDTRAGAQSAAGKKLRLTLIEDENAALTRFAAALKERGVKSVELSDIVAEALASVPQDWWDAKLEELTPLEFKLQAALGNPDLRAKLLTLLAGKKD